MFWNSHNENQFKKKQQKRQNTEQSTCSPQMMLTPTNPCCGRVGAHIKQFGLRKEEQSQEPYLV